MSDFESGRKRGWEECLEYMVEFLQFASTQPPEIPTTIQIAYETLAVALIQVGLCPTTHLKVNPPGEIRVQNYGKAVADKEAD